VTGFERAVDAAVTLQARPWVVLGRLGLARALVASDGADLLVRARSVCAEAAEEATNLGMAGVMSDAAELREVLDARRSRAGDPSSSGDTAAAFRLNGDVWTLAFAGRTVLMSDAKGLHDLHMLLSTPGREVAASVLFADGATERQLGSDPVLDERARNDYRRRLAEIDDDIDNALARHADSHAARLEAERDALIEELRRATGLGGRARRLGDENERARKTVTARIRDVLRRLEDRHPELAAHLNASISTGSWCRYEPDPGVSWEL
jgi:hypothetical protein